MATVEGAALDSRPPSPARRPSSPGWSTSPACQGQWDHHRQWPRRSPARTRWRSRARRGAVQRAPSSRPGHGRCARRSTASTGAVRRLDRSAGRQKVPPGAILGGGVIGVGFALDPVPLGHRVTMSRYLRPADRWRTPTSGARRAFRSGITMHLGARATAIERTSRPPSVPGCGRHRGRHRATPCWSPAWAAGRGVGRDRGRRLRCSRRHRRNTRCGRTSPTYTVGDCAGRWRSPAFREGRWLRRTRRPRFEIDTRRYAVHLHRSRGRRGRP